MWQTMSASGFKGFRYGVRTVVCQSSLPLLEFVIAHLTAEQPTPPDSALCAAVAPTGIELLELGAIYLNDERCFSPVRLVKAGDLVRIHAAPRRFGRPTDLQARICAENQDSIIVEKPTGLPTEGTVDNGRENLISLLEELRGQRFYTTHRLASDSEGLVLLAKTPEAAERIRRAFVEGKILRRYTAYVEAALEPGENALAGGLINILSCEERRADTSLICENRTIWRIEGEPLAVCYRIEIEFSKARPKEVRSFLAGFGSPVLGDRTLGSRYTLTDSFTRKFALAFLAVSFSIP
jgi:23S rRNA-/tRNA-specific pseudouridylate synthase